MDDIKDSLGKALRTAREAAGISMDDAVYLGKMPRDVIQALENEDFGFFNSPLYARSFLKQYGDYVGVDVVPWLDDIEPTAMIDGDDLESLIDLSGPGLGREGNRRLEFGWFDNRRTGSCCQWNDGTPRLGFVQENATSRSMHIGSLPTENSMTGFSNSAATSRITWMLSCSSCCRWLRTY